MSIRYIEANDFDDELSAQVQLDIEDDFGPINEDDEYQHELGYFMILLLRGDTVGRQLKQDIFKLGFFHLYCGIPMFIICCVEDDKYDWTSYFTPTHFGSPLLDLQYVVSFFALLFGVLSWLAVHHWASLVSNRELFTKISKAYQFSLVFLFGFSCWNIGVLYNVFKDSDLSNTPVDQEIRVLVYCSWIFFLPHLIAMFLYFLNINWLQEQVD